MVQFVCLSDYWQIVIYNISGAIMKKNNKHLMSGNGFYSCLYQ